MYHSVAENSHDPTSVSVKAFRDQVSWLLDHGFEPLPLDVMVSLLRKGAHRALNRKVAFTFDDGYRDFLTAALPVLLNHKAPATVFIVTGMLGKRASWIRKGEHIQLMSEDEIKYIKSQGISLGSHTMTHANLKAVKKQELYWQLTESRAKLLGLGEAFYALSYPWAQWSTEIVDAAKTCGYHCAVAAGGRIQLGRIDAYLLPRISMTRDMDLKRFHSLLTRTCIGMEIRRRCGALLRSASAFRGV